MLNTHHVPDGQIVSELPNNVAPAVPPPVINAFPALTKKVCKTGKPGAFVMIMAAFNVLMLNG